MLVIDGGTGTLIQELGAPMSAETWCADANLTHPEIVRAAHRAYLDAGAQLLIANTFATSPLLFNHLGRDGDVVTIDRAAVELARAESAGAVPIAGSFSTMRPVVPGGDRTPSLRQWTESEARPLMDAKAQALVDAGVDIIAMEMMRDGDYSLWATQSAMATGVPVWLGISVEEDEHGRLTGFGRPDAPLEEFLGPLLDCGPAAVTVMHSAPHTTTRALEIIRGRWAGRLGAYAESGYFAMPDWQFTDIIPVAEYVDVARQWVDVSGIEIVGGCCGIGPQHIAALRAAFG